MNIKNSVIEICQEVVNENIAGIIVDENTLLSREAGIDSLGIVTIIMNIEEKTGIQVEEVLSQIRKCKSVGELIKIIEESNNN